MWDIAARDVFEHDGANVVAAFEWAAARHQWRVGGELLRGALAVLLTDDQQALRLLDRTIEAIDDGDPDQAMRLHALRFWVAVVCAEFTAAFGSAMQLTGSPLPLWRVVGNADAGWMAATLDPVEGRRFLDVASSEMSALPPGPEADEVSSYLQAVTADMLLAGREVERALQTSEDLLASWDGTTEYEFGVAAARNAVVCNLMLDRPRSALEAADRGRFVRSAFGTTEFHVALCHIGLTDFDTAHRLMRSLAKRTVAGRVRLEAGNMLLVFAVLALAEGDEPTARELLLTSSYRRQSELLPYSDHIAELLGVRPEYEALSSQMSTHDATWLARHHLACIGAVRNEVARRGRTD